MLLGDTCTRGCKFCHVQTGNPKGVIDSQEPAKIALSVAKMSLDYIVLTSVDRDDLPDQGAGHFADTVRLVKRLSPHILVETLTPDWRGEEKSIETMSHSEADVLAHNIETTEVLQKKVRDPRCSYDQSLKVLKLYKDLRIKSGRKVVTKSSLMLGLGEKEKDIRQCLQDLLSVGVDVLTLGQYLQPSPRHLKVEEYVKPEIFSYWAKEGESMGFAYVASGPLVRSSYRAGEYYIQKILKGEQSDGTLLEPINQSKQSKPIQPTKANVISCSTF
jgi:lipoic acid synthetase